MPTPSTPPLPLDSSAVAAHTLHVELATRIATQRLHYRSGDEETAAASVSSLFKTTREVMTKYPGAHAFHRVALALLNGAVRPYTARWHGWMTQDGDKVDADGKPLRKFRDEWVRRKFREELRELQPRLLRYQEHLRLMSLGQQPDEAWLAQDERDPAKTVPAHLGADLALKLRRQVRLCLAGKSGRDESADAAARIEDAEKKDIAGRRQHLGLDASATVPNPIGLGLSGGGIRSATFCLGVVQTLHRRGLLPQFDYVSTVSGGGYLGSFLSASLGVDPTQLKEAEAAIAADRWSELGSPSTARYTPAPGVPNVQEEIDGVFGQRVRRATPAAEPPPAPATPAAEPAALRHLRNHSRFLLSGGTLGLLRIVQVVFVGFITSLLMLLTLPLAAAWALCGLQKNEVAAFLHPLLPLVEPWRTAWLGMGTLLLLAAGAFVLWRHLHRLLGIALCALALAPWAAGAIRWTGVSIARNAGWEHWNHPSGITFLGALALVAVLTLLVPLAQRIAHGTAPDSWQARLRRLTESAALYLALFAALAGLVYIVPHAVHGYEQLGGKTANLRLYTWVAPDWLLGLLASLVPAIFGLLTKRRNGSTRGWAQLLFYLSAPAFFILAFLIAASHLGAGPDWHPGVLLPAGIASAVLIVWAWTFVNINTFALHNYYRDRLCECYLVVPDGAHGVRSVSRLPLSLLGSRRGAPFHLINTTLNAAASKDPELRGRNGDFFSFSRRFVGSPLTGYLSTEDLERTDPHVDLGTAMAISAAAASTNMGWQTLSQFRFLMTLFNVRLGYWLPRPGKKPWPRPFEAPGPCYFMREMLGSVHEEARFVNLSDGGHLENLAVYELLRRQCKFIVAVDAGMEPGMECADLMRLQRYAAIDLGIRMHFDATDLTLLPTTYSRAYAVLVKIDYEPPAEGRMEETSRQVGWMLYLKLAVTGTEPRYVLDYRRQNPAFPHQTTADQFYDEAQFEAYRALGEFAAESLFREEVVGTTSPADMQAWFQSLANSLLPDNDDAFRKKPAA